MDYKKLKSTALKLDRNGPAHCQTKGKEEFDKITPELFIDIGIKNTTRPERVAFKDFWNAYDHIKEKEIKEFGVVLFKDFGNELL